MHSLSISHLTNTCQAPLHGVLSSEAKGAPLTPLDALDSVAQQGSPRLMQAYTGLPACHRCTVSLQQPGTSFRPLSYSACPCKLPYCFLTFLFQPTQWQLSSVARRCFAKAVMRVGNCGCSAKVRMAFRLSCNLHYGTITDFSPKFY